MFFYQLVQYGRFLTTHHLQKILLLIVTSGVLVSSAFTSTPLKGTVHWADALGEGLSALIAFSWIIIMLCARPGGRVTHLLFGGALLFWYASMLDLVDEFLDYPEHFRLFNDIESFTIPIAMLLITWGLVEWMKEQKLINRQLRQREHIHREYKLLDPLTQLYSETYLVQQLQRLSKKAVVHPPQLILMDIDKFSQFNQRHGIVAGDNLLKVFAELVTSHIGQDDLVCRCGGNRFAIVMTESSAEHAASFISEMLLLLAKQLPHACSVSWVQHQWQVGQQAEQFVLDANRKLHLQKQRRVV